MRRSLSPTASGTPSSCAPPPRRAVQISPEPNSQTKPKHTSRIVGPSASAIDTACGANPRLAFREPSIGSITTRTGRTAAAELDLAPLLGDRREARPAGVQPRELGEDQILRGLIDHKRPVAALAEADDRGAIAGGGKRGEHRVELDGDPPARRKPIRRWGGGLHAVIS